MPTQCQSLCSGSATEPDPLSPKEPRSTSSSGEYLNFVTDGTIVVMNAPVSYPDCVQAVLVDDELKRIFRRMRRNSPGFRAIAHRKNGLTHSSPWSPVAGIGTSLRDASCRRPRSRKIANHENITFFEASDQASLLSSGIHRENLRCDGRDAHHGCLSISSVVRIHLRVLVRNRSWLLEGGWRSPCDSFRLPKPIVGRP